MKVPFLPAGAVQRKSSALKISTKAFERQRHFLDFALSTMLRRKGKNAALLLVYTLIVFVLSSVVFFSNALREEATRSLSHAPEIVVQNTCAGRHSLMPLEHAGPIKQIRGVRSVAARLWGYYFHPASGSNYTIMAPESFRHGEGEAVVGSGVLRTWGTVTEEGLYFKTYDGGTLTLKIADSFNAETDLLTADLILVSKTTFRRLFDIPEGFATDLAVEVRNTKECSTIAEKITRQIPAARPITREEIMRTYGAIFDWRSGYVIVIVSISILAFFIFAWEKATGMSAEEKYEIGILKALGWDTSDILFMKAWEGLVISFTAFALGVILAYIHVFLASATFFEQVLKGWSILFPSFRLKPEVDVLALSTLFLLTVAPYSLITIIPTWYAASSDPDAVMRQ